MTNIVISEADSVIEVALNRPEKYNAVSAEMRDILAGAVAAFGERPDLRVMLIRAEGKYFTSGVEVGSSLVPDFHGSTQVARDWYRRRFAPIFVEMESIEKPIVVAHQGPCLGVGLEMSLSCDFRLAATSASYGLPETELGMLPGSGGTSRLTRVIGTHWARWLIMANQRIDADQALRIGLVHEVYPDEVFREAVTAFCSMLAAMPPETLALAKVGIELAKDLESAQARKVEQVLNSILFIGDERLARLEQFLDRQAEKRARRAKSDDGTR
jgi:enoyl-CoA hydratase